MRAEVCSTAPWHNIPVCEEVSDSGKLFPLHSLQDSRANGHDSPCPSLIPEKGDRHFVRQARGLEA